MLIYLQIIETDEDKSKFEQIYETYRGLMFHTAFKVLTHEQDAEDAVHHAFVIGRHDHAVKADVVYGFCLSV